MPFFTPSVEKQPALSAAVFPFLTIALAACIVPLIGWATDRLAIAGFGSSELLMQPWTATACISLALAFAAAVSGRSAMARIITLVPIAIAAITISQLWIWLPQSIDQALFSERILSQSRIAPGRPALIAAVGILLLSLAVRLSISDSVVMRRFTMTLCCIAIAISLTSGALLPLGIRPWSPDGPSVHLSVPTLCALVAIALAILAQRRLTAWPMSAHSVLDGSTLQWGTMVCTLIPVASALWQLSFHEVTAIDATLTEIAQVAMQVCTCCLIATGIWYQLSNERTARWAFSTAMDAAPIVLTDTNGRIIRWSKGCENLYGWAAREARGQHKHALTGAVIPLGSEMNVAPERPQEVEITEWHRDGRRLKILETRRFVRPRPDIEPMIVIAMTDITERHRAEQAMLASEARLAFAADLHELGLFEWSQSPDHLQLSPQAERLFGLEPGASRETLQEWRARIRQNFGEDILPDAPLPALSAGKHVFRLQDNSGLNRIIEGSIFFYERPGADGLSMLGIVMDVTERERVTENLKAQQHKLRSILETVPEAMITLTEAGHVREFSAASERLFGYRAEDIAGQHISLILPAYPTTLGETTTSVALHHSGQEIPVEIVVSEAVIGKDKIAVVFVRSLQDQIAAQDRLNELRAQLLHASRVSAMGEMGAGLAHELNQPLTATANLLGAAHMRLAMGNDIGKARDLVEMANCEVLRAGDIIRHMRNFVAKGEPDIRVFSLDALISDALQLVQSSTRHAGVNLRYLPGASTTEVLVDHIQVQQVLVNIIGNALETFSADQTRNPQITISFVTQDDSTVIVKLADNGPGFASSIIDRPFEAFVSTRQKGLGLGLSICRRIIEGHGGTLAFSNGDEGGAIIEFTLPIHRNASDPMLIANGQAA